MPKVSICIPTYNQVEYLKTCIQSILSQDYKDYEIIISDDSSNNLVEEYLKSLNLGHVLNYYKNPIALGTPQNWNYAISLAKGEYIKMLHHDDFFTETNSLAQYVEVLENNKQADFCFSSTLVWYVNTNIKLVHRCSDAQQNRLNSEPDYLFFNNLIGAPSATLYRKSVGIEYDKRFKWLVDVDFYISVLYKNNKICNIDKPLICTAHGAVGQVTQQVETDKTIQVTEHLLLLSKTLHQIKDTTNYKKYFDELFLRYNINSLDQLKMEYTVPENLISFLEEVFKKLNNFKTIKKIKYRLLNSKYNRHYFKIKKY